MSDQGTYDIEDDDDKDRTRSAKPSGSPKPTGGSTPGGASGAGALARRSADAAARVPNGRGSGGGAGDDGGEDDGEDDGDDDDDLLPPPLSRDGHVKIWFVVAGVAAAVLCISWLAGARALAPIEATSDGSALVRELGFGQRLAGLARTLVFLPLATIAITFGVLSLAFVRQRPLGDVPMLLARCAAIAAIGMLAWLVPTEIRFLKQSLNVLGPPLLAGGLTMPMFRLGPRDAALATGFSVLGLLLLTLFALVIVWAVGA